MPQDNTLSNAIDIHVGNRLRLARRERGLSQAELATRMSDPLSYQQIQKYEKGLNRIGAGQLWEMAQVLEIPVTFFFFGLTPRYEKTQESDAKSYLMENLTNKEMDIIYDLHKINNEGVKESLENIIKYISNS